jgi:hypothetical protein
VSVCNSQERANHRHERRAGGERQRRGGARAAGTGSARSSIDAGSTSAPPLLLLTVATEPSSTEFLAEASSAPSHVMMIELSLAAASHFLGAEERAQRRHHARVAHCTSQLVDLLDRADVALHVGVGVDVAHLLANDLLALRVDAELRRSCT